jgi:hypothetical protein
LEKSNRTVAFAWVKAHAGILGNELADQLPKQRRGSKIRQPPKQNTFEYAVPGARRRIQAKMATKLGGKSKGSSKKQLYPSITDKSKIHITSNFTAMVTGHGKTRAYLNRFKLLESATCPCNKGDQTKDHLLYHCTLLEQQREILEKDTLKYGIWPISKHDLITRHLNSFMKFTNSIDFDKL